MSEHAQDSRSDLDDAIAQLRNETMNGALRFALRKPGNESLIEVIQPGP